MAYKFGWLIASLFKRNSTTKALSPKNSDDYIIGKKSGVFAYLTSETSTACTLADTWYFIAGAFTNFPIEDFVFDTDHIKYTGTVTQSYEIDWHASIKGDANGITAHIGIFHNGVIVAPSKMGTFLKTANEAQALSGTCVVELAPNDQIQIVIEADGAGDIITIPHFTTTINQFFR